MMDTDHITTPCVLTCVCVNNCNCKAIVLLQHNDFCVKIIIDL